MSCSRHLHAPADAADADATRSCRALDRVEPTGSTPRPRRFLPRAGRTMTTFDAPVATRVRRSAARAARTAFLAASSKATFPTTQDVFHRRVPTRSPALARRRPRTRTRHRSRDFAAPARLPTLFRPTLPKEEGLDRAASERSSRPGAHGHAPLVDFCNRKDPQARPTDLRNPAVESGRAAFAVLPISLRAPRGELDDRVNDRRSTAREPRIHGSGAAFSSERARTSFAPASPSTIARDGSFTPTRSTLGHPLLLHATEGAAGVAATQIEWAGERRRFRRLAPCACAHARVGPPRTPLREKKMCSAAPEVPSFEGPALSGGALFHSLSPTCGVELAPFQSSRLTVHGRCNRGCGDSASPPE
jgi:hypothetical protein